ncbi:MAG TPA: GNAT family N-acetyltransferase, partial [Chthoniobacterales bacterium]|nr:GNAT family N-acetyltransferase [Chthoniobacterales bacterium]
GRRGVCLPFSDHCEPLLFDSQMTPESLLSDVTALAKERSWKFVEFRGVPLASPSAPAYENYYAHRLDLTPDANGLFENCASAFRRGFRKAERSGVRVEVRTDAEAVRRFYALHSRTRRRHGIPPQPFSFFQNICSHILARGTGFVVLASKGATPIAAAMFFRFQANGIFKFGASDHRHQELRASNLVMWEGIRECAARGVRTLHFGRTDLPHEGLRRFKLALGAKEETLSYYRYHVAEGRWLTRASSSRFSAHTAIFRRLPLTINRLAGTLVYPHLH